MIDALSLLGRRWLAEGVETSFLGLEQANGYARGVDGAYTVQLALSTNGSGNIAVEIIGKQKRLREP